MSDTAKSSTFTLIKREFQEYKNSFVWTPVAMAVLLSLVMLVSVMLAGRITIVGDAMMQVVMNEDSASGMNITIQIEDDDVAITTDQEVAVAGWVIETEENTSEEDWNFSKEWRFNPSTNPKGPESIDSGMDNLNLIPTVIHFVFLLALFFVTSNYLLGTLYDDRKDRSILFWRSMPVAAWEEVLAKLGVALFVAPWIFIALSMIVQLSMVLLMMLGMWRLGKDPFELVLGNIEFGILFFNQVSGWILTAFWIAPVYAWLMLASAFAKRSPFMLAVAPLIAIVLLEELFLGTAFVRTAIANHMPHISDSGNAVGFYLHAPNWGSANYLSLLLGIVFTAVAIWLTIWLRKYRWDI